MSDVKVMKKMIVQLYNILQVLGSNKVKFVSLSQLLGCPLFGSNSGLFTVPGFIVSLGGKKGMANFRPLTIALWGHGTKA